MEVVSTKLTKKLIIEIEELVSEGWYANKSEVIRDAIRDLIKKLKVERLESAIKEDIEWGLYGE
ncbi:transcriptional regulator [Candidatus Pacearchaeota archaeon CG10_big_fil_rev_8_21_14_0_10_35_13]|nr:MAG: transcriptional regulator [Candidatus Pacearchaeota archaeon CG10_big_fil_rev_8_21_14_0_10_35_13]